MKLRLCEQTLPITACPRGNENAFQRHVLLYPIYLNPTGLKFVPGEYVINYWATVDPKSRMLKKLESDGGIWKVKGEDDLPLKFHPVAISPELLSSPSTECNAQDIGQSLILASGKTNFACFL
jgi:hypothetical protein